MGMRVHVIARHEKYGSSEGFNWKYEEFNDFLGNDLGCDMCHEEEVYDRFECEVEHYERALSLIKAYKEKGRCKEVEDMFDDADADIDSFEDDLEVLGGLDYIINTMQSFYDERDKESDWISFSAW